MPQIISTEPLAQMLKSITLQQRTGILRIEQLGERNAGRGELYFEKGRLMRAYCGQETGEAAVQHIGGWKQITCAFHNISKPFPITTRILAPSRERTEEKPQARLLFSTVPQTENLSPALEATVTEHLKGVKSRPVEASGRRARSLETSETEAVPSTNLRMSASPSRGNQPLVLHGEKLEEYTPGHTPTASRGVQRWTTHLDPAKRELPRRPPPTPRLGPLPGEEALPGRTAIFKARAMVATTQAIQRMERRERIVFILLDGRRTIQDIARLTHQPESEVEQTLVHLTKNGYTQYIQG